MLIRIAFAAALAAAVSTAQSPLTTTFANNNFNAITGVVYFDLDIQFAGGVQIFQLDINTNSTTNGTIDVYTVAGSYLGNETNAAAWTLQASGSVVPQAAGTPTPVCLSPGFYLLPGTYGVAVVQNGIAQTYTNGNGTNQVYSNAEMTFTGGAAQNTPFTGTPFTPRVWNGNIYYNLGPQPGTCPTKETYGQGCVRQIAAFYELFPSGGAFDLANGTTISMLRQGNEYLVFDAVPGAFVPPSAAAVSVANTGPDVQENVLLSQAMPIPGGVTTSLQVTQKGLIGLSGVPFAAVDWTPTVAELLAHPTPTLSPAWNDFQPTNAGGSGDILFEEVGGLAILTFDQVRTWGIAGSADTFQIQFDLATGNISILYQNMGLQGFSYMVGYARGATSFDPGASDLSVDLAATLTISDTEIAPLSLDSSFAFIGGSWDIATSNIDPISPVAVTFLGARGPALPLSLIGIGAPGCDANLSSILGSLTGVNTGGSTTVSLPIPNTPSLAGTLLAAQSICLTLANPANLLASNAVEVGL